MSAWCAARGGWWAAPWNPSICVRCGEGRMDHCSKRDHEKWLYTDVWFGPGVGASNQATALHLGARGYEGALCRECDGLMVEHPGFYTAKERVQRAQAARGRLSAVQGGEVSEVCRSDEAALTLSEPGCVPPAVPLAQKAAHEDLPLWLLYVASAILGALLGTTIRF